MNYLSGSINIGNFFSHIDLKKYVGNFPDEVWFFFYTLLKFDIFNTVVSFYLRGHNFESEAKLNKALHPFFRRRYPGTYLLIFSQFHWKTGVNELKMFILYAVLFYREKAEKLL